MGVWMMRSADPKSEDCVWNKWCRKVTIIIILLCRQNNSWFDLKHLMKSEWEGGVCQWVCEPQSQTTASGLDTEPEQPSQPSLFLATPLPRNCMESPVHHWHPPSLGRCSMPNQWIIKTQLSGRCEAACHMPPGSNAICTRVSTVPYNLL